MPTKTFGQLTIKMYKTMDQLDMESIDVLALFERWTLDAIGIAGFGKYLWAFCDTNNIHLFYANNNIA
jgi:hypothetical protein